MISKKIDAKLLLFLCISLVFYYIHIKPNLKMFSSIFIRKNTSPILHNSRRICVYRSVKSGLFKKNIQKLSVPHDCLGCGGIGCGHCK